MDEKAIREFKFLEDIENEKNKRSKSGISDRGTPVVP